LRGLSAEEELTEPRDRDCIRFQKLSHKLPESSPQFWGSGYRVKEDGMRFRFNFVLVCLLLSLAMSIGMVAQEASSANLQSLRTALLSNRLQADCLGTPGLLLRRPGVPVIMNRPCKPVLGGGTETAQISKDVPRHDDGGTWIMFDVPGSTSTSVAGLNPAGEITGSYCDAVSCHGFLRSPEGSFTSFDVPGDAGTYPGAINPGATITGDYYDDINGVFPGFMRRPDGSITTFDVPGDVFGLLAVAINPAGATTGFYFDADFFGHGFLRASDGAITTFDVPGATSGTYPGSINPAGTIAGGYSDDLVSHGFLRSADGTITTFDVPGASTDRGGTLGGAINPVGAVTGAYFQPEDNAFGGNYRGFLRDKHGSFTTFDAVPSPSDPCCTWTFPGAINPAGEVVGSIDDYHDLNRGFVRATDGTVTLLDAPGAGTGRGQGTIPVSINPGGQIAGYYLDANYVYHGFLWIRR
jgi:hypothetical protein